MNPSLSIVRTAPFPFPTTTTTTITLTGVAPVEVRGLKVNGSVVTNLIWTTVTNWSFSRTLSSGSNYFQVAGYDRKTNTLPARDVVGYTNSIYVTKP